MASPAPRAAAEEAGLRYVTGNGPCIRRTRHGRYFRYLGTNGQPLHNAKDLDRIRSLVIPPAWEDVWICPSANGHLQAVGRDARGRKQYRYHPRYRAHRDEAKFSRMIAFGTVLALMRRRIDRDLRRHGLPREKVLAAVVKLLETTYIRVGNDEYARDNESFGLTTMKNRHVHIAGAQLHFQFRGKSGQNHLVALTDRRLARIVKQCRDLPGYELFQYVDANGATHRIDSGTVNQYIRRLTGHDFTAKDFRTWAGTLLAARELDAAGPSTSATESKRAIVSAVKTVARQLGNRPATCRKYYVHPAILDAYADGSLFETMAQGREQQSAYEGRGLRAEEYSVMVIIAKYQERLAKAA
ncbi:MAG: DNA topoisomerase IB [Bryobacteraceae bacterium]|jgi:DNA topoisomerase I